MIELLVAYLAYNMMTDLNIRQQQKEFKQPGGPMLGTLRGEIVSAKGARASACNPRLQSK